MRILVTGANGYIGSKVVQKLCDLGQDVIAVDIGSAHIDKRACFIDANIFDEKDNWFSFLREPDCCLHLAWRDGFIHDSDSHISDLPKHLSFARNLVDNGLRVFASMGTMHEIGYFEGCVDETTPCNPLSSYGVAKNAFRQALDIYTKNKNCLFIWLRAYYIYGDDSFGNSVFCKLRQAVLEGKKYFPFTSGKNKYDFIHIEELANQISLSILQKDVSGIINCCSGVPKSLSEQVEWYIKKNNLPIELEYGKFPDRPYDSPCIYGDNSKIKRIVENYNCLNSRVLITGSKGQLGFDCSRILSDKGFINIKGTDIDDVDITIEKQVKDLFCNFKPTIVIHAAAWTSVDKAELYPDKVYKVNGEGTRIIAECCKEIGATMVYISTDYVFDGRGDKPFEINDAKAGLSVYGKSKSIGEDYVSKILDHYYIVRISGAFGINGNNFVKTMINLYKNGKSDIFVVDDQIGSVTYTVDLANFIYELINSNRYGVYHATNEGFISWADFAREIFKQCNYNVTIHNVTSEEYRKILPNQATRPLNSRLSKDCLDKNGFKRLPDWNDALRRYLEEELTKKGL